MQKTRVDGKTLKSLINKLQHEQTVRKKGEKLKCDKADNLTRMK